jgi:hypothetical protein
MERITAPCRQRGGNAFQWLFHRTPVRILRVLSFNQRGSGLCLSHALNKVAQDVWPIRMKICTLTPSLLIT